MRKGDDGSSLELLLDTMCNTFGGVMFIAITLAVLLMSRGTLQQAQSAEERSRERREQLEKQIQSLRFQLEARQNENEDLMRTQIMLENDPRLKQLLEIAALEQTMVQLNAQEEILAKQWKLLVKDVADGKKNCLDLKQREQDQRQKVLQLSSENEKKKKIIARLEFELKKAVPQNITFTILQEKQLASYWYLLQKGKLWRIGPDSMADGSTVPADAVSWQITGNRVVCSPKDGCGVQVFGTDDHLSPECMKLLQYVPQGRGAVIALAPEDSGLFYRMREELKQRKFFHGFTMLQNNCEFIYYLTTDARYEY